MDAAASTKLRGLELHIAAAREHRRNLKEIMGRHRRDPDSRNLRRAAHRALAVLLLHKRELLQQQQAEAA